MIKRTLAIQIKEMLSKVPVVTLTGPRQSGKTTLLRAEFPDFNYVNLEDPKSRRLAQEDYEGFFEKYPEPLIIDEVQRVPELLESLQVRIDQKRDVNGRFILTGSHQPKLKEGIAQSLAGRTSLFTLLPLSISELKDSPQTDFSSMSLDSLLLRGFMPELYRECARSPQIYYRDYLETYIEKDLRQMANVKNLDSFLTFLKLLAGRTGQVVNLSSLGGEVGVSSTTLSQWLSVLEASFVVFKLQPYFSNISKQLVKAPKIYFSEPALAAYLLGIEDERQMSRDPLRGSLFENLVVTDFLKNRLNRNLAPSLYYLRTAKGLEVDLILKSHGSLFPFEVKSAMTPNRDFARSLSAFCKAEETAKNPTVIYSGEEYPKYLNAAYVNYRNLDSRSMG